MKKLLVFFGAVLLAAAAHAQQYKWVDQNGRVQYGDNPPPGVKAISLKAPSGSAAQPAAPAAKDAAAKAAKKGPLSPAEQEQDYRKRQAELAKAREKEDKARQEADAKMENCTRAQEALRTYESGQRIARTNAQGERYYMDDDARASETDKARETVKQWCN